MALWQEGEQWSVDREVPQVAVDHGALWVGDGLQGHKMHAPVWSPGGPCSPSPVASCEAGRWAGCFVLLGLPPVQELVTSLQPSAPT